ncbi:MAG: sn-glycerol-1-phosphate dehydrogenase [Clostridia bacterium]|nr:sn-glycerol-1-phosphate dehydrogenase [Clostridia bacterium]MBQ9409037.1 sn-glycerol-1-phosphate dehydrogenase [Clostridia bacterium]
MSYTMKYSSDGRLQIGDIVCGCGSVHNEPKQDIYVGCGIVENVAAYINRQKLGQRCVLVADNVTWQIAGSHVSDLLCTAGFDVTLCVIEREGRMEPDETAIGEVAMSLKPDTQFLVSVGSGAITDITRMIATRVCLPQVCIGTAPSMDGYTSSICPLTFRGVKVHRQGKCPEIILCDIDILKTAPMEMVCSGVGDVLGKYIAIADWKIGKVINDEVYCDVCGQIVMDAVNKLLTNLEEIKSRSTKGIQLLTEALLLSGMTIMIIGHTRAVASVEHNVAHYWEMMQLLHGEVPPSHGASVGVATLLVLPVFKAFAGEDLSRLDLDSIKKTRLERGERVQWMYRAFEKTAAESIMAENEGDFLSWEEQKRRILRAQARFAELKAIIEELPDCATIENAMRFLGCQMTPAECGVDEDLLNLSMRCAKDYRTRYTLFKLISECGLEEKYLGQYTVK